MGLSKFVARWSIGNLNDVGWDLERLWNSQNATQLRTSIHKRRCACTWECAQGDNVLFQPRMWPALARATLGT